MSMQAFQLALEAANAKAATTAFFDDSARNVAAGHAAGLFSVLVGSLCSISMYASDVYLGVQTASLMAVQHRECILSQLVLEYAIDTLK